MTMIDDDYHVNYSGENIKKKKRKKKIKIKTTPKHLETFAYQSSRLRWISWCVTMSLYME